ncbi:hypothetical protein MRB53_039281 [Persea americana]|nr:hypothetical protein MRB53_039281 [Persea americana]
MHTRTRFDEDAQIYETVMTKVGMVFGLRNASEKLFMSDDPSQSECVTSIETRSNRQLQHVHESLQHMSITRTVQDTSTSCRTLCALGCGCCRADDAPATYCLIDHHQPLLFPLPATHTIPPRWAGWCQELASHAINHPGNAALHILDLLQMLRESKKSSWHQAASWILTPASPSPSVSSRPTYRSDTTVPAKSEIKVEAEASLSSGAGREGNKEARYTYTASARPHEDVRREEQIRVVDTHGDYTSEVDIDVHKQSYSAPFQRYATANLSVERDPANKHEFRFVRKPADKHAQVTEEITIDGTRTKHHHAHMPSDAYDYIRNPIRTAAHDIHAAAHHVADRVVPHPKIVREEIDVKMTTSRPSAEDTTYKHTITIPSHHIRIGDLLILQGRPCQVIRISTSPATGQHRYLGVDLFSKQLYEETSFTTSPAANVVVQNMRGPVFKQYRVLDMHEHGHVVAMTEGGSIRQGLRVVGGGVWGKMRDAWDGGRVGVRVLVIEDGGEEMVVDFRTVHGSQL